MGGRLVSPRHPSQECESRQSALPRDQLGNTKELLLPLVGGVALDPAQLHLMRRSRGTSAPRDLSHLVGHVFHDVDFQSQRAQQTLILTPGNEQVESSRTADSYLGVRQWACHHDGIGK